MMGNRSIMVLGGRIDQSPERCNPCYCNLAKQCFTSGSFYFETQVKDKTRWTSGVAKESIKQKGVIPQCSETGHWTLWLKKRLICCAYWLSSATVSKFKATDGGSVCGLREGSGLILSCRCSSCSLLLYRLLVHRETLPPLLLCPK